MTEKFEYIIPEDELIKMERFFENMKLPEVPIAIDKCSTIIDIPLFVKSHVNILKSQRGNLRYKPYLDRLIELKHIINQKLNDYDYQ